MQMLWVLIGNFGRRLVELADHRLDERTPSECMEDRWVNSQSFRLATELRTIHFQASQHLLVRSSKRIHLSRTAREKATISMPYGGTVILESRSLAGISVQD